MIDKIASSKMLPMKPDVKINDSQGTKQQFSELLKSSIEKVNQAQITSEHAASKLINGDQIDLHNVMITSQKALITLQTTVEVRNKAVEAYQEMMRMQV